MAAELSNAATDSCRICLDTNFPGGVSFDEGNWLNMYEYCFGITITPQDIPRKLCSFCVNKMKDFAKLKDQSLKSDKLWRKTTSINLTYPVAKYQVNKIDVQIKCENSSLDYNDSSNNLDYNFDEDNIYSEIQKEPHNNFSNEVDKAVKHQSYRNLQKLPEKKCIKKLNKTSNKSYKCNICKTNFKFKIKYKQHVMENKCRFRESVDTVLIRDFKDDATEFYCGLCDVKTPEANDIIEHLKKHSLNNDLSCKLCDYTGRDFADMETHRYNHQPHRTRSLRCHLCDKKFYTILALQYHYRSVHLKKAGGMCSVCNKVFTSHKSWREHERMHIFQRFICDFCGMKFLYRTSIEAHMKDHADYKGFVCDVCGNRFKRMSNLKLHIEQVHDDKRVKCTHCDKTFKNEKNLQYHLSRETKEKKYQCEVCSKRYHSVSMLKKHMIWHNDERPYACHLCGSAYKAKAQLKIHIRSHTGEMPYKCTHCPRAFPSGNQLKVHLNVHSGNRRYKCQYCEKTFHNKKNVVVHCSKRHNINNVVVVSSKNED